MILHSNVLNFEYKYGGGGGSKTKYSNDRREREKKIYQDKALLNFDTTGQGSAQEYVNNKSSGNTKSIIVIPNAAY